MKTPPVIDPETMSPAAKARTEKVVFDIIEAIREVIRKDDVTFAEYRAATAFLMDYVNQPIYEIPLMLDLWFNSTVTDQESTHRTGTPTAVEGPYFLADVPQVTDALKTREGGTPLLIRGKVTSTNGASVAGTRLYLWQSDDEGNYSGFSDIPKDHYRGYVELDASGEYAVKSILPVPYSIPLGGITHRLLSCMGRHPWRPAHIHYKLRNPAFKELTSQAHFKGHPYTEDDCVDAVRPTNIYPLEDGPDGKVLTVDFTLEPA